MIKGTALILVGGKGTRLWPISRADYPKQFVEFKDGLSLFQLTIQRLLGSFRPGHTYIIASARHKFTIFNQIDMLPGLRKGSKDILKNNLVLEPCSKNTAGAIMLGLKYLGPRLSDDRVIYVFPSDHVIEPESRFSAALARAWRPAAKGRIVVFGIKPASAQPGYGYIQLGRKVTPGFTVDKFVEKPSPRKAQGLLARGALWNAGIFCFKKQVFLEELARFRPDIYRYYSLSYARLIRAFPRVPAESIDYAIMQKTKKALVLPLDLRWSDLGSWDNFLDFHSRRGGNLKIGKAKFLACKNCFSYSQDRAVSLIGLEGVMAIDSPDALLIVKRGASGRVKDLVGFLEKKKDALAEYGATVYRPWGHYTVFKHSKGYKVKKVDIYPGRKVSLQKHQQRSEHWNVVEGRAVITIGRFRREVKKNQSVFVPKGEKHKIYNPGRRMLRIIEVQIGSYLGEDDIKRYDSY